ncbi:MAG: hypothetical protein ABSC05_06380 [Candidatus Solibacter sp.]
MKASKWTREWPGAALWAAGAVCLAVQLLLPGFIGIANNGDFGKVYGWLCLAPRGAETNFKYVQPDYVWSARNYWNSPYHSSESALGWLATRMAGATYEGAVFDIRWMGAMHAALCLAAFGVLLAGLRGIMPGRGRMALMAIVPLLVFTDVCYTAYLNSFYMDAAALGGLLLMAASAVWMAADREPRAAPLGVFALAALLFVTSKAQHAVWMGLPAALLIARGAQWNSRRWRGLAWSAAGLVLLAGAGMLSSMDDSYRGQAMFNILFFRLGPAGADLQSLGVKPEELRYNGMHAYLPGAPVADRAWSEEFGRRTGFGRLLGWYARHPGSTLGFLAATLKEWAPEMRPSNLGNFRAEQGRAPGAQTERFALWSDWRGGLLRRWPWHMVAWYAVFLAGCLASGSPLRWVAMGIAALGAGEFTAAGLGDALDAPRHLLLFQAATDLTVCFAAGWLVQKTMRHTP